MEVEALGHPGRRVAADLVGREGREHEDGRVGLGAGDFQDGTLPVPAQRRRRPPTGHSPGLQCMAPSISASPAAGPAATQSLP